MRLPFSLFALAASILAPAAHASSTTRNPLGALSAVQNATIHTYKHRLTALSDFDLTFNIRDQIHVKLHLEPNHDILADDTIITHYGPDGNVLETGYVNRLQHKVYRGTAWVQSPRAEQHKWLQVGWARIMMTRDGQDPVFSGAVTVDHDHHHIQTSRNYQRTKHTLDPDADHVGDDMVVWRDSDILPDDVVHQDLRRSVQGAMCLSDRLGFNSAPEHPVYTAMARRSESSYGFMDFSSLLKRQIDGTTGGNSAGGNLVSTIGNSAGCPTTRKVALVGVATDCTYTQELGGKENASSNVIDQMNTASGIWENAFNISLGLANIITRDPTCPGTPNSAEEWNQACSSNVDIQDRLNLFSAWRGQRQDNYSHWTLLSTCNTDTAVGLAWLGQACTTTSQSSNGSITGNGQSSGSAQETVAGANVVIRTAGAEEWQVIAHETGHTFGAVHDCEAQTCSDPNFVSSQQCCPLNANTCNAGEQFIMNPSTTRGVKTFSLCSIGNICSALLRNAVNSSCLSDNRGVTTITGQQCGNGIVEPGEDCDCGGEEGCADDPCCNASTCKFTTGSVCDDSNEDCCSGCQFAASSKVCRASTSSCDPQEFCTGNTGSCPPDTTEDDGTDCGNGLHCAAGQCTSRDQQCKSVMGTYTQGNDTYACDSQGCAISCASPEFGYGVCYSLQQNFLDGTNCGGGGHCLNGQCKGSTFGGQVKSWIDDHKALVIGLSAGIGGLLLLSILSCIFSRCRRGRRRKRVPAAPVPPPGGWQGWNQVGSRGSPMRQDNYYAPQQHPSQGWANPPANRGTSNWPPPPPPPTYQQQRSNSVRYA